MEAPCTFYKYRSLAGDGSRFLQSLLSRNELYLSAPSQFNDPFDCAATFDLSCTPKEAEELAERTLARTNFGLTVEDMRAAKVRFLAQVPTSQASGADERMRIAHDQNMRAAMGIYSLSARADSPLMWSHYADSHRGLCIGFDSSSEPFNAAQKVKYSRNRIPVNPFKHGQEAILTNSILQKSIDWMYEEEWRIAHPNGARKSVPFDGRTIKTIVFGAHMQDQQKVLVREWLGGHEPLFYQASVSKNAFTVDLAQI